MFAIDYQFVKKVIRMCGILGGNNSKWNYDKAIKCMRHRGPDGIKISAVKDFTLAFARLAIMDLSDCGMQPMFSSDKNVCIVFNGEIYGYQRLRNQLTKRGYRFNSSTDTEAALIAYLEWGEKFVSNVDGMFGMAIYDKRNGTIKLFRDRMGIKPLYYYYDGWNFGFSSELKGILNMCSTVSFKIDRTAIYDYLNYCYIPDSKTYYKNVYKLLPGHYIEFNIKKRQIIKNVSYWRLKVNEYQGAQRKQEDLIEELRELIKETVEEQMIADVPVGTFLSGGVDSSIVTYEGAQVNPQLETFSVGFTKMKYNELNFAREFAHRYGINMNEKIFNSDIFERYFHKIKDWYDEPFADTSAFPTYIVSKMAKEKVSVVLTGDGGDEVFGGYHRYDRIWQKEKEKGPDNLLISRIYDAYLKRTKNNNVRSYYWMDDLTFLLKATTGKHKISDKDLRKQLGIANDYDKFWALRKY